MADECVLQALPGRSISTLAESGPLLTAGRRAVEKAFGQ